ncbi:MAG: S1 RNA-binding domain-containing protein [Candidatus Paceibacterota bacterium]
MTTATTNDAPAKADEVNAAKQADAAGEVSKDKNPEITHQAQTPEELQTIELEDGEGGVMASILEETPEPPQEGDIVEGPVIGHGKNTLYIDLPPFGTGIIFGKEYINARDLIKRVAIGDTVTGKVVEREGYHGYIEVSLKEARQALIWSEAEELVANKTVLELPVIEANKGGLIISWQGIQGFLPASQLKTEHYPRVEDGDKDRILDELRKLVGEKLSVSIISAVPSESKLIFSEKTPDAENKEKIIDRYTLGDEVVGEVTGIVDFGIFVKIEDGLEGLVHISEIDWSLVEDPKKLYNVGDEVRVKIVDIKDGKISLSIKALKANPWKEAEKRYQRGEVVRGVVIKYNKHGALASIEEGIAGLIHVSEFGNTDALREALELGKTYPLKITLFDPDNQRMALMLVDENGNPANKQSAPLPPQQNQ